MQARIDLMNTKAAQKFVRHINAAAGVAAESSLPEEVQGLVVLRSSQINGCGFCTDMHYKDALKAGEDPVRLNLVAAWREATVFTEPERAALGLAEAATRIADSDGVSDEVWADARKHYDDEQLAALISAIALINAYNRMNVIARTPAGSYVPGQFG